MAYSVLHNRCGCGVILKHPIKVCDSCHKARANQARMRNLATMEKEIHKRLADNKRDHLSTKEALEHMRANPGELWYNHVDGYTWTMRVNCNTTKLEVCQDGFWRDYNEIHLHAWDRMCPNDQLRWYRL